MKRVFRNVPILPGLKFGCLKRQENREDAVVFSLTVQILAKPCETLARECIVTDQIVQIRKPAADEEEDRMKDLSGFILTGGDNGLVTSFLAKDDVLSRRRESLGLY